MKESKSKIPEKSMSNVDRISDAQEIELLKGRLKECMKKYDKEKKISNQFYGYYKTLSERVLELEKINKCLDETTHAWIKMYNELLSAIGQSEMDYNISQKRGAFRGLQNRFNGYNGEAKIIKMDRKQN